MVGMDYLLFMFIVCVIAFFFLYIRGNYYLREGFTSTFTEDHNYDKMDYASDEKAKAKKMAQQHALSEYNTTGVRSDLVGDLPYATTPIQSIDDYEYSMIFKEEGSRVAGKRAISDAMSRYPLDWSAQPPSSQLFQERLEGFVDAVSRDAAPVNTSQFNSISGKQEQPPNQEALEEAEKKLLATYNPEHTKDLLHYSLNDTKRLLKQVYAKKGLIPVIEKSSQGTNVFEVVETREINPTIVWEDDPIAEVDRQIIRGENRIEVPLYAKDTAAGLDPFFEPRQPTTMGKHDYTKWTPGLERSFAPTYTGNGWASGPSSYNYTATKDYDFTNKPSTGGNYVFSTDPKGPISNSPKSGPLQDPTCKAGRYSTATGGICTG